MRIRDLKFFAAMLLALFFVGCSSAFGPGSSNSQSGGAGGGTTALGDIAAPTLAQVLAGLSVNNARGMVVGQALGAITLPVCTMSDGSALEFEVAYSMSGLPAWLTFTEGTRALSLTTGVATLPAEAYAAQSVIYTCTAVDDTSVTASRTFTVNDLDAGGVTDAREYQYAHVPLLDKNGWAWLDPSNVNLYRTGTSTFRRPTNLVVPTVGFDPQNAADDVADFDVDANLGGGLNNAEITALTNVFVVPVSTWGVGLTSTVAVGGSPFDVSLLDVDADGDLDLVVSNSGISEELAGDIRIYLNNGDRTFSDPTILEPGQNPTGIASGDLNNDGYWDFIGVNRESDSVSFFSNSGTGAFAITGMDAGNAPEDVVVADFNGDGWIDIAIMNTDDGGGPGSIVVSLSTGAGLEFNQSAALVTRVLPRALVTADFNRDGNMDIAVTNSLDSFVSVFFGNGDGTFGDRLDYAAGDDPRDITVGDFNGDGYLDIAVAELNGAGISVFINDGDGTFANLVYYTDGEKQALSILAADFDGDGDIDIMTTNNAVNDVSFFRNDGAGVFEAVANDMAIGGNARSIAAGDIDGDGRIDIVTVNFDSDTVTVLWAD